MPDRRDETPRIIEGFLAAFLLMLFCVPCVSQARTRTDSRRRDEPTRVDLLLKGGKVVDGSGGKPRLLDVGISGDRVVFIGKAAKGGVRGKRVIDVTGLVVAPGFIDPHTHTLEDLSDPVRKGVENYLMQGVTTVFTGNDGGGPVRVAETLGLWSKQGIGANAALLVGHGTVREQVMKSSQSEPSPEQLREMKLLVARAMDEGAFGISTGLYYIPGSYAKTEEVIELSKVVAARGGIYDTHMRDEDSYSIGLLGSIRETIRIGREAGIPVHISHIKALGREVWGKSGEAIRIIKEARAGGVNVTANQYPYTASGTSIAAALIPRSADYGEGEQFFKNIEDPATRARLVAEVETNMKRRGGAESLLITAAHDGRLVGKTLAEAARERGVPPAEAALQILKEGGDALASFNMSEADVDNFMRQDFVSTGSDGSVGHPRKYGTFPRKLREYVYRRRLISLPFAIRSGSALTAESLHLPERGLLRAGYFADVIVFDEKTVADRATYERPRTLAVGMRYVIVNGKISVEDGRYNGSLNGRPLRKTP